MKRGPLASVGVSKLSYKKVEISHESVPKSPLVSIDLTVLKCPASMKCCFMSVASTSSMMVCGFGTGREGGALEHKILLNETWYSLCASCAPVVMLPWWCGTSPGPDAGQAPCTLHHFVHTPCAISPCAVVRTPPLACWSKRPGPASPSHRRRPVRRYVRACVCVCVRKRERHLSQQGRCFPVYVLCKE